MSSPQKSKIYNESAFTGYGVQATDGKFGAFTSSRPMFNIDPNNPIKAEQTPQQIVSPAITNNTSPKLYNVNIIAEDMSDGTRDLKQDLLDLEANGYDGYLSLESVNSRYYEKPWTAEEKTLSAFDMLEKQ